MRSLGRQGGRGHGRGGQGRPVVDGGQGGQVDPQSVIRTGNGRLSGGDPTDLVDEVVAPLLLPAVRGEGGRERERGRACGCRRGHGRDGRGRRGRKDRRGGRVVAPHNAIGAGDDGSSAAMAAAHYRWYAKMAFVVREV